MQRWLEWRQSKERPKSDHGCRDSKYLLGLQRGRLGCASSEEDQSVQGHYSAVGATRFVRVAKRVEPVAGCDMIILVRNPLFSKIISAICSILEFSLLAHPAFSSFTSNTLNW